MEVCSGLDISVYTNTLYNALSNSTYTVNHSNSYSIESSGVRVARVKKPAAALENNSYSYCREKLGIVWKCMKKCDLLSLG